MRVLRFANYGLIALAVSLIGSGLLEVVFEFRPFWGRLFFRSITIALLVFLPTGFTAERYWGAREKIGYWGSLIVLTALNAIFIWSLFHYKYNPGWIGLGIVFGAESIIAGLALYAFFDVAPPD
jgi:hypothetical protein